MTKLGFTFDGIALTATPDMSVAAALTEAGTKAFRQTDSDATRGIFCGMGVCQDCLVTIDGIPNQRACMTPLRNGMQVETQVARPKLTAPPAQEKKARRLSPSVLVVGGGAGGLNAAISAREMGADVLLLDERKVPGGQYFKQNASPGAIPLDTQQSEGKALYQAALDAGVQILSQTEVWGAFDGPEVMAANPDCVYAIHPSALIVATGAYERPAMIPGWTLPGVMTVGAAQTLWRSYRTLPGRRIALFGNGPLTSQVALELADGGAEITILGEAAASPVHQLRAVTLMIRSDMQLAIKGIKLLTALRRKGVSVLHNSRPTAIVQTDNGLLVTYAVDGKSRQVTADTVCMNFGFQPQNEILRLLGAKMRFDADFDQLRPERSEVMETTVSNVYAIGDCCGLGGAPAAAVEGRIAGRAAAGDTTRQPDAEAELARHRAFQHGLWQVYATEPAQLETVAPETLVCRCEEISKSALDSALANGHTDIGAVKRATRVGMGRCQGRYCGPALAGYMARRLGVDVQDLSYFAPRIPIKPVDIGTLVAAEKLLDDDSDD